MVYLEVSGVEETASESGGVSELRWLGIHSRGLTSKGFYIRTGGGVREHSLLLKVRERSGKNVLFCTSIATYPHSCSQLSMTLCSWSPAGFCDFLILTHRSHNAHTPPSLRKAASSQMFPSGER